MARGMVTLKGFKQLEKKLLGLEKKVAKKLVRRALRDGAKIIHQEARLRVPVKTGRLRRSIKVKAAKKRKKHQVAIIVQCGEGDFVGDTFYGGMIEFGYEKVPVYRGSDGRFRSAKRGTQPTTTVPPQPFMRPAFDSKKGAAVSAIENTLSAGIVSVAKEA